MSQDNLTILNFDRAFTALTRDHSRTKESAGGESIRVSTIRKISTLPSFTETDIQVVVRFLL